MPLRDDDPDDPPSFSKLYQNNVCVWIRIITAFAFYEFLFLFQPHCLTKSTMNCAWIYYLRIHKFYFSIIFSLKMSFTVLFTHLKKGLTFQQFFHTMFCYNIFSFSYGIHTILPLCELIGFVLSSKTKWQFTTSHTWTSDIYVRTEAWNRPGTFSLA